jgi:hypothetical protein
MKRSETQQDIRKLNINLVKEVVAVSNLKF